jgi:peptidoglycan/LPS O-acetylase OafA/YrhL
MKRKVFLVALVVALAMLLLFLAAPVMAAGSGEPSASGGVIPDTIMWALVVGFFMPLIIAVIQQRTWATWLRSVVAFVSCAAAAAITCVVRGDLATKTWISSALIVLVEAIATYELWKL